MAKPSKEALAMAFDAGRAMQSEPGERHGLAACPFEEGDPQRDEWLRGYEEILGEMPSAADLKQELASSAKIKDGVSSDA